MNILISMLLLVTLAACGSSGNSSTGNSTPVNELPTVKLSSRNLETVDLGNATSPLLIFNGFSRETESLQENDGDFVDVVNHSVKSDNFNVTKHDCTGCSVYLYFRQSENISDGFLLYAEDGELNWSLWAGGNPPTISGLPAGEQIYNGRLMIVDRVISRSPITVGDLVLTANFDTNQGSFESTTVYESNPIYKIAGNIIVSTSDGTISSRELNITDMSLEDDPQTVNIDESVGTPVNAFMKGSFHGTEAQNVTGVLRPNYLSTDTFVIFGGAFFGSRTQ